MGIIVPLVAAGIGAATGISSAIGATTTLGTLAGAGTALASAAGGVGSIEQYEGAQTQAAAAKEAAAAQAQTAAYQQQVAQNQAQLYNQQAAQTMAAGEQQSYQQEEKTRANIGAIEAAQGASGIDVTTGSAPSVRTSAAQLGQLSALTLQSNAARQAWGSEMAGTSAEAQAGLYGYEAQQAPIAGQYAAQAAQIAGTGSLLSSASGFANQYAKWGLAAGGPSIGGASAPSSPSNEGYAAVLAAQNQPSATNAVIF